MTCPKSAQKSSKVPQNSDKCDILVKNVTKMYIFTVTYLDFVNSGFDLDLLSIVYNRDYP